MVLKLYQGETCVRTIYNVFQVKQIDPGTLIVKNKGDGGIFTIAFKLNKDYYSFIIMVD